MFRDMNGLARLKMPSFFDISTQMKRTCPFLSSRSSRINPKYFEWESGLILHHDNKRTSQL